MPQDQRQRCYDWSRPASDSPDSPAKGNGSYDQLGRKGGDQDFQRGSLRCTQGSRLPISPLRAPYVRPQYPVTSHQADRAIARTALGELASIAEVIWDLDGGSRRRSESGAGADEALAHLDHDGHLRAVRSCRAEASRRADEPDDRFEEKQTGRNEGDVTNGTNSIVTFCDVTRILYLQRALISKELLVELVGIEPTTSSLRTMRSPS